MAEETKPIGNETVVKSGRGRIQVSLLDDTVVAFQVEVWFAHSLLDFFAMCYFYLYFEFNMCILTVHY